MISWSVSQQVLKNSDEKLPQCIASLYLNNNDFMTECLLFLLLTFFFACTLMNIVHIHM